MRGWRFLGAAALLMAAAFLSRAQGPDEVPEGELHFGAGSCAAQACHGGGISDRQEYKIWATRDRHSRAFDSLSGERGRRIGERLGIDPTSSPRCLNCHGAVGVKKATTFDLHDGVSCELCHGGAGRWLGPHAAPGFGLKPPAEKERLGLRDLSTPAKRAAVCVSCHVGSERRDITHEIMAAGHPALAFDLGKFQHDMPPHWKGGDPAGPEAWAQGAKAVTVARLRHVARAAARLDSWPEFAAFDCYACHHTIGSENVYARTKPPGRPGDLPLDLSALEVLAAAVGDETLAKRLGGIVGMTYRPGADRRDLADFAARAAGEVELILPDATGFGEAEARTFGRRLDTFFAKVETDEVRATYAVMQQAAFAVFDLVPDRENAAFLEVYGELEAALAPGRPYDARACAKLARRALAAR